MSKTAKILLITVALIALSVMGGLLYLIKTYIKQLPSTSALEEYKPSLITKVYDINKEVIAEMFTERRTVVPLQKIPVDLQNAVIAIEDERFFKHWGIDLHGIIRAILNNLLHRRIVEGGSTITQQLARALFLTQERTIERKIKEALLALVIEKKYTKEEILQMYLNQVYFGQGAYGVEQASRVYFGKHVQDLNLAECALLAGLLRAPKTYSPFERPEAAKGRAKVVLNQMYSLGFINSNELQQASNYSYCTQKFKYVANKAPYIVESIKQYLEERYGSNAIYKGGLQIYTTLDLKMQKAAEELLNQNLTQFDVAASTNAIVQGALVAIDPKTGQIKALIGGRNFEISQFNRATQAQRQPGSAFKVFVAVTALENGFTPTTLIDDSPITLMGGDGKEWSPKNYDEEFWGPTTLRRTIEYSRNVCAAKLITQVTPEAVIHYAQQMGIESPLGANLSLALGTSEVNLLEITSAYSTLANQGIRTPPYSLIQVLDNEGNLLERTTPKELDVLSEETCFLMTNILKGVIQRGTGFVAKSLNRPAAGKTGTTNDYTDAWFIGYTPQLVCGVWVGYDDRRTLGDKKTGGVVACPIWTEFMQKALGNTPVSDFPVPDDIVFVKIDPQTGLLASENYPNAFLEAFIKGTEPKEYAQVPKKEEEETKVDASGY